MNKNISKWFWRIFWLFWIIIGFFILLIAFKFYINLYNQPDPDVSSVKGIIPKILVSVILLTATSSILAVLIILTLTIFVIYLLITLIIWVIKKIFGKKK